MKSLELLESHRRKVAFWLWAIIIFLLYWGIFIFEFILLYFWKSSYQELLGLSIVLAALSPFIYVSISFLCCRVRHRIYKPIRENMQNLENFTVNVNHEFKTSLSEIISSLELWQEIQQEKSYSPVALSSARRLNIILDSLTPMIRFSNADYRKKRVDIVKLFDESISDFQDQIHKKSLHLTKKYDHDKIIRSIDEWPLLICFQNILQNAIKYSHQWGNISISISKHSFEIRDDGVWIENENIEKIFDRNFQEWSKSQWIWVWLSLVKRLCDMYHWDIGVESEKGKYTIFTINF